MTSIGVIGFGDFGRFMVPYLAQDFEVRVHDRREIAQDASSLGARSVALEECCAADIVILCVPFDSLDGVLESASAHLPADTLVVDVCSVKTRPLELMRRRLPEDTEIVGLHPMFGPQSGRDGIEGLKVVLCADPDRTSNETSDRMRRYLEQRHGLRVLEMAPEDHDREMAYIQGLTHWMAKALREIRLPNLDLSTVAYRHMMKIEEILREDSLELFLTIERANPFAREARRELMRRLVEIEQIIDDGEEGS